MCKLTKNLPIHGLSREVVGFSEFRGEDCTRGEGKNSGVETPVGVMLWDI